MKTLPHLPEANKFPFIQKYNEVIHIQPMISIAILM